MSFLPQEILDFLRDLTGQPELQIQLLEEFGAQAKDYRAKIKTALPENLESSISHTQGLGGFASVATGMKIGFDIEVIGRVSDEVAKRVSADPQEFHEAPTASHLWAAKEAAFKALKDHRQPNVLSALRIYHWRPVESPHTQSPFETFQLETPQLPAESDSFGVSFEHKGYIFGLFIFRPTFLP